MYTRIGMLLDNCGLYARLSGYQNLKIMSIIYGLSDDEIIEVLKEVELLADKDKAVFRMSKGMQQRLAFAKAILNKPEILFLDEPTTGLEDVYKRQAVCRCICWSNGMGFFNSRFLINVGLKYKDSFLL